MGLLAYMCKTAAYKPIQEGDNIAKRNDEYFDHTPGMITSGSMVGAADGLTAGGMAAYSARRMRKKIDAAMEHNPTLRNFADATIQSMGFEKTKARDVIGSALADKRLVAYGAGGGLALGALGGAYKGMMTGTGMNDRQFLLQRDLEPHEVVKNSAMSALNMAGPSLNPAAPAMNQAFGTQAGALHRMRMKNKKNGELEDR